MHDDELPGGLPKTPQHYTQGFTEGHGCCFQGRQCTWPVKLVGPLTRIAVAQPQGSEQTQRDHPDGHQGTHRRVVDTLLTVHWFKP